MASTLQAVCQACGAVIADLVVHATWHASLGTATPPLAADITTLDPSTGLPVVPPDPAPTPEAL